ncbi:hypothetical protein SDC9_85671 [bioreactor metagenome]|uniref:Single-stranded DNA-binding protein n=1 Tax=bioreactor metagenome TaxID=1076179 RepID=A0A644ZDU5_9ZZZZ
MKVVVLGKEHLSGIGKKSGKPYDSNVVHIRFKQSGVDGEAVDSVWLDPAFIALAHIEVGATYDLDRDGRGQVVGFERVGVK